LVRAHGYIIHEVLHVPALGGECSFLGSVHAGKPIPTKVGKLGGVSIESWTICKTPGQSVGNEGERGEESGTKL
jgi:hypothetical protein